MFNVDGVTYMHVKEGGVEVVATTRANISPSFVLEFLRRVCTIIKVRACGCVGAGVVVWCGCLVCGCGCGWVPGMRASMRASGRAGCL